MRVCDICKRTDGTEAVEQVKVLCLLTASIPKDHLNICYDLCLDCGKKLRDVIYTFTQNPKTLDPNGLRIISNAEKRTRVERAIR